MGWITAARGRGASACTLQPLQLLLRSSLGLMGESESRVALPVCVRVCKLAFVPRPKPTLLLNDTLARPPHSPLQLLQARTSSSSSSLPLLLPALANSSHVFNISLWTLWVLPARAPPPPPPPASPMRLGRCHHIWETAAGVCSLPSLPSPGACGESVMARLSAGPSPVIRRVNTQRLDGFGRGRGRGGRGGGAPSGSCPTATPAAWEPLWTG